MIPAILSVLAALTICAVAASLTYLLVERMHAATAAQALSEAFETYGPCSEPGIFRYRASERVEAFAALAVLPNGDVVRTAYDLVVGRLVDESEASGDDALAASLYEPERER